MADIFLSYAREDQSWARLVASALESRGWSVWWDRRIPPGKDFNTYIEQQLAAARCIVVLWSKRSIVSTFVRDEATEGLTDGRLVPVLIETVRQPIGFRQFHAADLSDWRDGQPHEELDRLLESIRAVVPPFAVAPPAPAPFAAPASASDSASAPAAGAPAVPIASARRTDPDPDAHPAPDLRNARIVSWKPFEVAAEPEPPRPAVESRRASGVALGIDLGSTNAVAAIWQDGGAVLVETDEHIVHMPAVVAFTKSGEQLVGLRAKRQAVTNRQNTIISIRQFMGRAFKDVEDRVKTVPYLVVRGPDGDACVDANGAIHSPPEIAATILLKLKAAAEKLAGRPIPEAVITVPAYFDEAQREATRRAAQIAGFEVVELISDPVAAVFAHHLDTTFLKIAIYDFGGAAFAVSIVDLPLPFKDPAVNVRATNGDAHLGGDDLDRRVVDYILAEFRKIEGIDLNKDAFALQRVTDAAETAKIQLSSAEAAEINLPFITADRTGPKHLQVKLTRARFERLIDDLVQKTARPVKRALSDAAVYRKDVDTVLLAGGSTLIPSVRAAVRQLFGKEPKSHVDPSTVVAIGAARYAALLQEYRSTGYRT